MSLQEELSLCQSEKTLQTETVLKLEKEMQYLKMQKEELEQKVRRTVDITWM